jgi:hypothetical protein
LTNDDEVENWRLSSFLLAVQIATISKNPLWSLNYNMLTKNWSVWMKETLEAVTSTANPAIVCEIGMDWLC